jgi:hypothetical protein
MSIGHNGPPADHEEEFIALGRDGWVAVARAMRDHWLVGFGQKPVAPMDPDLGTHSRAEAWLDLIMECRYSEGTVSNNGVKMRLEAGQLLGAVSWLASRWNWTPKTVRGFLDKLEDEGMIERYAPGIGFSVGFEEDVNGHQLGKQRGKQASVLTVSKYSLYQLSYRQQGQAPGPLEGKQRASKGQAEGNIYKEETKEQGNKEKIDSSEPRLPLVAAVAAETEKLKLSKAELARLCATQWNVLAVRRGLPEVKVDKLNQSRINACVARLREHADEVKVDAMLAVWEKALAMVERSKWLLGQSTDWRADFDFVCQPKKFSKLLEGGYGNGAHAAPSAEREAEADAMDAALERARLQEQMSS